jgi:hypothetical protein
MVENIRVDRFSKVEWVCSSRDNMELAKRYDEWAREYDADLGEEFG